MLDPLEFYKHGPRVQAYFRWLDYKSYCQKQSQLSQANFEQWQARYQAPPAYWLMAAPLIGAAGGIIAMTAALNYSGRAPVNIWVILVLFALLPFITSILSFWKGRNIRHGHALTNATSLIHNKFLPRELKTLHLGEHSHLWLTLLLSRAQLMVCTFQISAIACFFALLLFKDVQFGWSSTLLNDSALVHKFFTYLTLPWQLVIPAPSQELISASQFYYGQDTSGLKPEHQWWPHLAFAMLTYGLAPRLLLTYYFIRQFSRSFYKELCSSVELTFQDGKLAQSRNAITPDQKAKPENFDISEREIINSKQLCICWQRALLGNVKVLGSSTWEEDKRWLEPHQSEHGCIVVAIDQTPTAELSDVIALFKSAQMLVLIGKQNPTKAQLLSWHYFSEQNKLALQFTRSIEVEE